MCVGELRDVKLVVVTGLDDLAASQRSQQLKQEHRSRHTAPDLFVLIGVTTLPLLNGKGQNAHKYLYDLTLVS